MSKATSDSTFPNTADLVWRPKLSDVKKYLHFDSELDLDEISELVSDSKTIKSHTFSPLLHFEQKWRRPPKNGINREPKIRPIRYACRKDAYIYKHYRTILSKKYEAILRKEGLQNYVLAYRKIPLENGSSSNKNNIYFAKDAFECIDELGKCTAVAVDISDFFGSLEDNNIKRIWNRVLGTTKLPDDHKAVFKSIVNYRFVKMDDALVALGYSEYDTSKKLRYKVNPKRIPKQLCSRKDFREKIVGAKLVKKRDKDKPYGIPQGTPISDLLANMYLLDFDIFMKKYAEERNGYYFRYSDDILLIIPGDGRAACGVERVISRMIKESGEQLKIKPSKTEIVCYTGRANSKTRCYSLVKKEKNAPREQCSVNEGLSYLGFRYDGSNVFIRNSTLSNLRRKVIKACVNAAYLHVRGHKEKDLQWLLGRSPVNAVKAEFMNVEDFEDAVHEALEQEGTAFKIMTFWSYVRRAKKVFGKKAKKFSPQLKGIDTLIKEKLESEIEMQFKRSR